MICYEFSLSASYEIFQLGDLDRISKQILRQSVVVSPKYISLYTELGLQFVLRLFLKRGPVLEMIVWDIIGMTVQKLWDIMF